MDTQGKVPQQTGLSRTKNEGTRNVFPQDRASETTGSEEQNETGVEKVNKAQGASVPTEETRAYLRVPAGEKTGRGREIICKNNEQCFPNLTTK